MDLMQRRRMIIASTELPPQYQRVEYIQGTGTQFFYTNINSRLPMSCVAEVAMTDPNVGTLVGARSSSSSTFFFLLGITNGVFAANTYYNNYFSIRAGSGSAGYTPGSDYNSTSSWVRAEPNLVANERHVVHTSIDSNGTQSVYVDGYAPSTLTKTKPTTGYPIGVFRTASIDTVRKGKIYRVKLYTGSTLLANLIPCYRKSDNTAGMYDCANKVFYTNQGTDTFILGRAV